MIKLIKTLGGSNGAPRNCRGCGSIHFVVTGHSWHCLECNVYVAKEFKGKDILGLRSDIDKLQTLKTQITKIREELEKEV